MVHVPSFLGGVIVCSYGALTHAANLSEWLMTYGKGSFEAEQQDPSLWSFGSNSEYVKQDGEWDDYTFYVRRICEDCTESHQNIIYKRITKVPASMDVENLFLGDWFAQDNVLGVDFNLYNNIEDARNDVNEWKFCNYDDGGIGFPRDCGPESFVAFQWNSLLYGGVADFSYQVYAGNPMIGNKQHSDFEVCSNAVSTYTPYESDPRAQTALDDFNDAVGLDFTTNDSYYAWCVLYGCPQFNSEAESWCSGDGGSACTHECVALPGGTHPVDGINGVCTRHGVPDCDFNFESDPVRFEKFNITSGSDPGISFPVDESDAEFLRQNSRSWSIMLPEDECTNDVNYQEIKDNLEAYALYPPSHPEQDDFWSKFAEVVNIQSRRRIYEVDDDTDDPLHEFLPSSALPELWTGFDITEVAEAVHDEFPGIYFIQMITQWLNDNSLRSKSVIPKFGQIDFLRGPVLLSDMVGLAIRLVGPCNFSLKWENGRARPEEVAWKIRTGELVPPSSYSHLIDLIEEMNLDRPTRFTAYAEGSPTHPSWPAMHSAASAASFWLNVVMDLTEEQLCEARKLDYGIAYARTLAGVHYPDDNIAGLLVGQEILAQRLPAYLESTYDATIGDVEDEVRNAIYDWTQFTNSDCYRGDGGGGDGGGSNGQDDLSGKQVFPPTSRKTLTHGFCIKGARYASASASGNKGKLDYNMVRNFGSYQKAWKDRTFVINGVENTPCQGGIFLQPSQARITPKETRITVEFERKQSSDSVMLCAFVEPGKRNGGWTKTLPQRGFTNYGQSFEGFKFTGYKNDESSIFSDVAFDTLCKEF